MAGHAAFVVAVEVHQSAGDPCDTFRYEFPAHTDINLPKGSHAASNATLKTSVASTSRHIDMVAAFSEVTRLGGGERLMRSFQLFSGAV